MGAWVHVVRLGTILSGGRGRKDLKEAYKRLINIKERRSNMGNKLYGWKGQNISFNSVCVLILKKLTAENKKHLKKKPVFTRVTNFPGPWKMSALYSE